MTTLLLLRHGRTRANADQVLSGRAPGISLDEVGKEQAKRAAEQLREVKLATIVTSPLERCQQTAQVLAKHNANAPEPVTDDRFAECDYGTWTGRPLDELRKEQLWQIVSFVPSRAVFPNGEALAAMQARAMDAVRNWQQRVTAEYGPDAIWLICSHEDVLKAIIADLIGLHLDMFQRIVVQHATLTIVRLTESRAFLMRLNETSADLGDLLNAVKDQ